MRRRAKREVKLCLLDRAKWLFGNKSADVAVEVAAVPEPSLDRIQPVLPTLDIGGWAQTVFKKQKPTSWPENSVGFMQRPIDVGNAAVGGWLWKMMNYRYSGSK